MLHQQKVDPAQEDKTDIPFDVQTWEIPRWRFQRENHRQIYKWGISHVDMFDD
jgi:hypothetical protein